MQEKRVRWHGLIVAFLLLMWVIIACQLTTSTSKPTGTTGKSATSSRRTATSSSARPFLKSPTTKPTPTPSPTPTPVSPWSGEPLNMTNSSGETVAMTIALGPDYSVHAAWAIREEGNGVYLLYYEHRDPTPGAAWSTPELVLEEPIITFGQRFKIQMVVDPQSAPHLFWNGNSRVVHLFKSPTGWESDEMSMSDSSAQAAMPSFAAAVSPGGNVNLLWEDQTLLFWSVLSPGGEWMNTHPVFQSECEDIGDIGLGSDGVGLLNIVWEACGQVWFNNQLADMLWSEPIQLANNATPHVAIAVEPPGGARVAWYSLSSQDGKFWQMDRSPDGTWSEAFYISSGKQEDVTDISLALAGEAGLALFGRWPYTQDPIRYLTRRQGETWSAATALPDTPGDRDGFALIGDGRGNLHMLRETNQLEEEYHLDYAVESFQAIALPEAVLAASTLPTGLVEFAVVTGPGQRKDLSITGDWVVWSQKGEDWDVYAANLATGEQFPITTQVEDQLYPVTDGKIVVWEDHQEFLPKIHVFDLQTRQERLLNDRDSPQWMPDLSGNLAVFGGCECTGDTCDFVIVPIQGYPVGFECTRDIWATNLSTGENAPIVQRGESLRQPRLSGTWLIWNQSLEGGGEVVGALDLGASSQPQILDFTRHDSQSGVRLDGTVFVWMSDNYQQIWAYNLANGDQASILFSPNKIGDPDISGGIVVWADNRNGSMDIFGYNLATGEEFPICLAPGDQVMPSISGNVVVWVDQRLGSDEIYAARLPFDNPGVPTQFVPAPAP